MVGIQSSLGMAAYGRTAQLGNSPAERSRADADKQAALKEANKQATAETEAPESARDIRPPESAARREPPEARHAAPPRGSVVDIAV